MFNTTTQNEKLLLDMTFCTRYHHERILDSCKIEIWKLSLFSISHLWVSNYVRQISLTTILKKTLEIIFYCNFNNTNIISGNAQKSKFSFVGFRNVWDSPTVRFLIGIFICGFEVFPCFSLNSTLFRKNATFSYFPLKSFGDTLQNLMKKCRKTCHMHVWIFNKKITMIL